MCQAIAPWLRICSVDALTIGGLVLVLCYVVWGIDPTVNCVRWLRWKLFTRLGVDDEERLIAGRGARHARRPQSQSGMIPVAYKGYIQGNSHSSDATRRHSRSSTVLLQRFMHRSSEGGGFVPPTTFLPDLPHSSPSASSDNSNGFNSPTVLDDAEFNERLRLARFRFPPRSPPRSRPVEEEDDFFSLGSLSPCESLCSGDLSLDQDLLLNPYWTHKGNNPSEGASFGMLNFEDSKMDEGEDAQRSPPPSYEESRL
ncbi:hypothetical protein BDW22DRAFT_1354462 [Trametopsis cervina]|nr:hypothetical protein BDW22DRAFT_1354462 [Trametopsis cervina]